MAKARYMIEATKDTSNKNPFEYWGNGVSRSEILCIFNKYKNTTTSFYALWIKVGNRTRKIILDKTMSKE